MITAINSATSFKAFYKPNNYQFSDSQQAVIKDIEVKLGDRTIEKDYCVTPYGENSVALYKVSQPKTSLQDPKSMRFDKMGLCAVCDEWHPLDIKKRCCWVPSLSWHCFAVWHFLSIRGHRH